jgi:localization factor PodJL
MKSGGPWNLRGLRPEARVAAREAARRSGMSVGEWLNTVIQPADEEDGEPWRSADFERDSEDQWRRSLRYDERERGRYRDANWGRDDREPDAPRRQSSRYDERERERERPGRAPRRPPARELDDQFRQNFRDDDRERGKYRDTNRVGRDRFEDDEGPVRREGGPYREEHRRPSGSYQPSGPNQPEQRRNRDQPEQRRERAGRPRRERERYDQRPASRLPEDDRDTLVDQAVAEITARQRALDGDAAAEIRARQRALDGEPADGLSFSERQPLPLSPLPEESRSAWNESPQSAGTPIPAVDFSGLERQLRHITTRVDALRPSSDLETAIDGLRTDLAEIGRSLTEALPRRAMESLEIEVKALSQRIDHSREAGVDSMALAGLERGLADVREALRKLTPAESLVGFEEAVKGLAKKVDGIVAKEDPAALQQLETAIGALRGIVSHVASNDTLTKVAEEVRALAAKVDGLANSGPTLSALGNRIDMLATALKASTDAGHAVPRELEKLLAGLIEKLEWVQLTHTDHTALAHLEDRIATLVKRLDSSDARFGLLEGIERGLADLLVYIEQLRGTKGEGKGDAGKPVAVDAIEQEVARTQDSLEAVRGTVEHVVDRLAMIESDMRVDKARPAPAEPLPVKAQKPALAPPVSPSEPDATAAEFAAASSATAAKHSTEPEPEAAPRRLAVARAPIDPNLPPDHPLEPGFTVGRSRNAPSAADRIAASEAAIGSKPPVIPDPGGGKSDFIAAARRAAQAAALASPHEKSSAEVAAGGPTQSKKLTERLRTLIVAAAVFVIVVGGFHIVSRLFENSGSGAPSLTQTETPRVRPPQVQTEPSPIQTAPPQLQTDKPSPPASGMPGANPANLPMTILPPLPGADAAQNPGAAPPPKPTPGTTTGDGPGRQSLLEGAGWPSAVLAGAAPDKRAGNATANGLAPWATPEITGSLPRPLTLHSPATVLAPAAGDKLPVAIGGPALRAAALAGDASAAYGVAVRFAEGRVVPPNNEEAARWFERAAKKGLASAQFRLGSLYEKGVGVKKDLAAARDLYRAAADKGHGKAMHNLAVLYAEGIDGAADYRTAVQWFRKAADRGITDSQYNLAVLYARGVGVEQNFAESYKWFFLAAKEDDHDAAQKRDEVASHLDEPALAAARLAAEQWTPVPQPADAITVKAPEAWDPPAKGTSAVKPKSPSTAKVSAPDATKAD